jgi:hypothetical protein
MVTPTISNVQICHVLIDGGAGLNVMSLHAFEALQIPMSKLKPLRHSVVGATILCGRMVTSLSLSHTHTFGTMEYYRTEMVVFDVANIDLLFNAMLGRLALSSVHHRFPLQLPCP